MNARITACAAQGKNVNSVNALDWVSALLVTRKSRLMFIKLTFIDCECKDGEDHMCGVGEVCHNCHCLPKGKLFS